MVKKSTRHEANESAVRGYLWYMTECCRRSPGLLRHFRNKDPNALQEFIEDERLRSSPVVAITSDCSEWVIAKLDLRWPPSLVAFVVERMLTGLRQNKGRLLDLRDDGTQQETFARVLSAPDRWEGPSVLLRLPRRLRLDNLVLSLKVWDYFRAGNTFAEVAGILHRPVSTIRDLYRKVAKDISGPKPVEFGDIFPEIYGRQSKTAASSRNRARLTDFDLATHRDTCVQCRKAGRESDFCPAARTYLNQDQAGMREATKSNEALELIAADESLRKGKGRRVKPRGASPKA